MTKNTFFGSKTLETTESYGGLASAVSLIGSSESTLLVSGSVVPDPIGGNFDGTGDIRLTLYTRKIVAPTS